MNWNEWRKFCSENGLSLDQASETWQNYKELKEEADRAALDVVHNLVYGEDEEEEEYNPVEEILDAKEELGDMFSGEAILETDTIKLFEKTDKVSEALVDSLKEIKAKRDYHSHMAKALTQEGKDMIQEIIKELRRSF